jgi:inorganic triphosphatase YgiF
VTGGSKQPGSTETETTLVVVSDTPEQVADAVAALTELDGFALQHRPDEPIRDRYVDTADGLLGRARTSVRVREVGPKRLLTIKGPATGGRGGETREEHEIEWSGEAWALLREKLGAELEIPDKPPVPADPIETLAAVGLDVIQERETLRRVRAVVPPGQRRAVAELAIDAVTFRLGGVDVRHYEIEIEVKAPGGEDAVAALADSLLARFGPELRLWRLGKLSTGKAVVSLIEDRESDDLLTDDGTLRPSAYDAIAGLVARGHS